MTSDVFLAWYPIFFLMGATGGFYKGHVICIPITNNKLIITICSACINLITMSVVAEMFNLWSWTFFDRGGLKVGSSS